jgi:hypothetical protein
MTQQFKRIAGPVDARTERTMEVMNFAVAEFCDALFAGREPLVMHPQDSAPQGRK